MANNCFSDELAFSVARFSSYEKGKEYFEDGCVEKIWKDEDEYKAIVKGTQSYHVSLRFTDEELKYDCTCPYELGGACKHVIASILAFASDKNFAAKSYSEKDKNNKVIKKLLAKVAESQLKLFLGDILNKQPQLIEDFKVFLQGTNQTPVTVADYENQFRAKLDQMDLNELLQIWFAEGEDYYGDNSHDGDFFTTESLSDAVDSFIVKGEKYEENQNFGEALKIYQSIFEALSEKEKSLPQNVSDLSDWFIQEMEKVVDRHLKTLAKSNNDNLKKIGVAYLCHLFQTPSLYFQEQIFTGLKQAVVKKDEAMYTLESLEKTIKKNDLSAAESSLLSFLYFFVGDWERFEAISLKNLNKNPGLTLDLLKYYRNNHQKDKTIQVSNQVFNALMKKGQYGGDYKEIEIQIRTFLKDIFSPTDDYQLMISNLERLFLITGSLSDYKELVNKYRDITEKEKFWQVIKKYFDGEYEAKNLFKVFKFEEKKEEILNLLRKYPKSECFPEMISFVQGSFSNECFSEYKKKIDELLKETDVRKYSEAVYHLKRMQKIGLEKEFNNFVNQIKKFFWRRRRLIEELRENQL